MLVYFNVYFKFKCTKMKKKKKKKKKKKSCTFTEETKGGESQTNNSLWIDQ